MEFTAFTIRNFKGIEKLTIPLSRAPKGPISTLVGLNESGKTTVLEAISYFETKDRHFESLYREDFPRGDVNDLVPLKKKANFNDTIDITATLALSDADKGDIAQFAQRSLSFKINPGEMPNELTVSRMFKFENSIYKTTRNVWSPHFMGIPSKGTKQKSLISHSQDKWVKLITHIRDRVPAILYFPTFLFEFPSRIYLQPDDDETPTNAYYREIIQDVLDSLNDSLTVDKHIVNRALEGGNVNRRNLDSVLTKMGNVVTKTIFESWNKIFARTIPRKDIVITCDVENLGQGNSPRTKVYLEFMIKDGDNLYLITERSLGFRWFFCFLLFTQFRQYRRLQSDTLFLFDEPASNLHSRAQMQLLQSFTKITASIGKIIYSTHSHYMINPHWLENAYIVRNEALRYDDGTAEYDYSSRDTNIKVEPYRRFVGENPTKLTYFQPILDTLDYLPSNLEHIPDAVLVEGKNDFYLFKYFQTAVLKNKNSINFIPGVGASGLDTLIALYLGWGRNFIIILDDDREGRNNRNRYIKDWLLPSNRVFTLRDVTPDWDNHTSDKLLSTDDMARLKARFYPSIPESRVKKKDVVKAIQELLLRMEALDFSDFTKVNFEKLTVFCREKLLAQSN